MNLKSMQFSKPQFAAGMLAVAMAVLVTVTTARAETPSDTYGMIEEIVVTAQKRSESLQSVPISITALTSAQLKQVKMDYKMLWVM